MDATTKVFDFNGERILVGSKVKTEWHDDDGDHVWIGVVKSISDPDADVDDEGRPYGINPSVWVQWEEADAGDEERFSTHNHNSHVMDEWPEYGCEELEVVNG